VRTRLVFAQTVTISVTVKQESLAGKKFGEFGESRAIRQTKTIQIPTYNYNLLAEFIHSPKFFAKCSKRVNSPNFIPAKLSHYMVYLNQCSTQLSLPSKAIA